MSLSLASVGGFLEAYTFVTRGGVFANAQTGNIARLGLSLAQGDFFMVLRYLIPVLTFVAGVTLSIQIKRILETGCWERCIILAEAALLFMAGLFPPDRLDIPVTALVSFVCAIQVEGFRRFGGYTFASTMCTGNLRSGTENMNRFFEKGDRDALRAGLKYYGIDAAFALSVAVGYFAARYLGGRAVWCTLPVLGTLLICFTTGNKKALCQ